MPSLLEDSSFPEDAKERAQGVLAGCKGSSLGSYSDSPGIEIIRRHVADYIEQRDGQPSSWEDIILCAGASEGIRVRLNLVFCCINKQFGIEYCGKVKKFDGNEVMASY